MRGATVCSDVGSLFKSAKLGEEKTVGVQIQGKEVLRAQ